MAEENLCNFALPFTIASSLRAPDFVRCTDVLEEPRCADEVLWRQGEAPEESSPGAEFCVVAEGKVRMTINRSPRGGGERRSQHRVCLDEEARTRAKPLI